MNKPATIRLADAGTPCHCEPGISPHDAKWIVESHGRTSTGAIDYYAVSLERRTLCWRSFDRVLTEILTPATEGKVTE